MILSIIVYNTKKFLLKNNCKNEREIKMFYRFKDLHSVREILMIIIINHMIQKKIKIKKKGILIMFKICEILWVSK